MSACASRDCNREADLAIRSTDSAKYGLVNTIYQRDDLAPKRALPYCVDCGMHLARELARLSNPEGATS